MKTFLNKKMSNYSSPKFLLLLTFMLLGSNSGTNAQISSGSCYSSVMRRDCTGNYYWSTCCSAMAWEVRNNRACICNSGLLTVYVPYCETYAVYIDDTLCEGSSSFSTPSSSTSFQTPGSSSFDTPSSSSFQTPAFSTPSQTSVSSSTPTYSSNTYSPTGHNNSKILIAIGAAVVIIGVLITIGIICICCLCSRKSKTKVANNNAMTSNAEVEEDVVPTQNASIGLSSFASASIAKVVPGFSEVESLQYDLTMIQAATSNFSSDNEIGRGGFGVVYKGTLSDGRVIAVKRLSKGSTQGDEEFKTEVILLAKLQHPNLVRLLGFYLDEKESLLVYEYVPNQSLNYFLFDTKKRQELNWRTRFDIIRGIAQGLVYLHEGSSMRTIHRDLKAANILLDAVMNPKIADFGLARICSFEQTHIATCRIVGTEGYMAPEYLLYHQFSVKSDVYSFGVMVLEIINGTRIRCQPEGQIENLMAYAWRCSREENPIALMDPMLKDSFSRDEVEKCVHLGLLCIQEDINKRPTMSTIVQILNSYSCVADPTIPHQNASFLFNNSSDDHSTSSATTKTDTTFSSRAQSSAAWSSFKVTR